jgi:hypothetical protein
VSSVNLEPPCVEHVGADPTLSCILSWKTPKKWMEYLQGDQRRSMGVKRHIRCSQSGFAARVGDPHTRSETKILVYAVVCGECEKGWCSTSKRHGRRDAHGGRVDWNGEKHTKSAQEDYTR